MKYAQDLNGKERRKNFSIASNRPCNLKWSVKLNVIVAMNNAELVRDLVR